MYPASNFAFSITREINQRRTKKDEKSCSLQKVFLIEKRLSSANDTMKRKKKHNTRIMSAMICDEPNVHLHFAPLLILLLLTYCVESGKDSLSQSILSCHIKSIQSSSKHTHSLRIHSTRSFPMCCRSHHLLIYGISIRHAITVLID
ncbi:hypothetical protein EDC96DRAFT_549039 [Choanephora cucurbitarum]|nr:hypothetical protein EDC96DRAFT_549039 [Choanephora cucurbitarum]